MSEIADRYAAELADAVWRKSSYTMGESACVEVVDGLPGVLPVRDSKRPDGPVIVVDAGAWSTFVDGVKRGALAG